MALTEILVEYLIAEQMEGHEYL